ncbi:MAG: adenosylcobalamin-dependent ribonucleoside-diphosphate reductase [Patescibacteria group bacterium]|nr:adenosylcobalamin-dependent ribonucleoside-diphosphate reductase [Patescibacteria group bacterium]
MKKALITKTTSRKQKTISLQVSLPEHSASKKLTNGHSNGLLQKLPDVNSRTFENMTEPRYKEMPPLPENLPQPEFSQSSEKILKERYLLKGGNLEVVETIAERFWHVAFDIASGDFDFRASKKEVLDKAIEFYKLMVRQEFIPNSPTLMNAGKHNGLQYSACFVLPIGDSLPEIFDSLKYAALIHQTGGGTGFAFSRLRPRGSHVKTTGGVASGPVSFLRAYNAATETIKQGGTRRGANMGILRVDHPDVLEFIRCKSELDEDNLPVFESVAPLLPDDNSRSYFKTMLLDRQISNFNISIAITDKFMEAYYKGEDYELIDPHNREVVGTLQARDVFNEIIDRAWQTGDPGVVFIDRINNSTANPVPSLEQIESTNPCGEQPLGPWDSCNLGSINLVKFVKENGSDIDWDKLRQVTHLAVNFLDNVVQTNPFNLRPIYDQVHSNRRIGLGVMGWADMLFKLKVPYNCDEALKLAEKVMGFINKEGHLASQNLARERGAFPNWPLSIYKDDELIRNSTVTTIAPTGSISIIADCSSGIEPVFALAYLHKAKGVGNEIRTLTIANKTFEEIAKREGFYSEGLAEKVMERGSVWGLEEVPEDWQRVFVTAQEIDSDWHVKMQASFQKYTDNGVSKTINLSNSATRDDVLKAYLLAWETGCKGITIYRDGSKGTQVLNVSSTLKAKAENISSSTIIASEEAALDGALAVRPIILRGRTYKVNTPVGKAFVTVNRDETNQPFEVFVTIGKAGMHTSADAEAIGRLTSLALRISREKSAEVAQEIVTQLRGIGGSSHIGFGKERVMSLADAIAKALAEDLAQSSHDSVEPIPLNLTIDQGEVESSTTNYKMADLCPECGQPTFTFEEGCKKCHSCGYSMC